MQKFPAIKKFFIPLGYIFLMSCGHKIRENKDSVYSRHLQKHIDLEIISTPVPDNKNTFNLLLLNDGQDIEKLRVKEIVDSLYKKKLLQHLLIVAINAYNRMEEYGVAGYVDYQNNGSLASKYAAFISDELIPFVKKKSGVRKFNSITIAGWSLGGLSAFDIAWDHADKINKVGVFSGSLWYSDKDLEDPGYSGEKDRLTIRKLRSSRKKPHLKYWFYAGRNEEIPARDEDGVINVVDNTKDVIDIVKKKNVCPPEDIRYTELMAGTNDFAAWSKVLPQFLLWVDGQ